MGANTSYDVLPYESFPYARSSPAHLATIATLLGLRPAQAAKCRVLELGCAGGGNLIPHAATHPESFYLGVDLSHVQVAEGHETIRALALPNIELKHQDLLDLEPDLGRFDYIICHGVYSWVPARVQEKILEICKKTLSPAGVAYVSYNTYPGWHMRAMIRDMLMFHSRAFAEPGMKVSQARNLLDFLGKAAGGQKTPYGLLLESELQSFRRSSDAYLFHEHLEIDNNPVYFHEFVEQATAHGLRYLAEADLRVMVSSNFPPEIENVLQMLSQDTIHLEQYMDFLRNRMFRQTLLCHKNLQPNYKLRWETLRQFHLGSPAVAADEIPDIASTEVSVFKGPDGVVLNSRAPLAKAAMLVLSEVWPSFLPFAQLVEEARGRLRAAGGSVGEPAADEKLLGETLLSFYASASTSLIELSLYPQPVARTPGEFPMASALARLQAIRQNHVTNLRHVTVWLDPFERTILKRLDGAHDRAQILAALTADHNTGDLQLEKDGQPIEAPDAVQAFLTESLEQRLAFMAKNALLTQ